MGTVGGLGNNLLNTAGGLVNRGLDVGTNLINKPFELLSSPIIWIVGGIIVVMVLPKLLESGARAAPFL